MCHELGHSTGLRHWSNSASYNYGCMESGTTSTSYVSHHIDHMNSLTHN
jgi:hypothetical protein